LPNSASIGGLQAEGFALDGDVVAFDRVVEPLGRLEFLSASSGSWWMAWLRASNSAASNRWRRDVFLERFQGHGAIPVERPPS
jgi:hypothetical protein